MKNESICTIVKKEFNDSFKVIVLFNAFGDGCEDIVNSMEPLLKDVIDSETVTNIMSRGEPGDNDVRELRDAFKSEIDKSPLLKFDGYRYVSEYGSFYKREGDLSYRASVDFLRVLDVPQSNPCKLVAELNINIYPIIKTEFVGIEDLEESDEQENQ